MKTTLARRTAANLRATFVIVAFATLAAVGLATTKSLRPQAATTAPASAARAPFDSAPAACPMPVGAFTIR